MRTIVTGCPLLLLMSINIYVASTSKVKVHAVQAAFEQILPLDGKWKVQGCENIVSDIPEQPIGIKETKLGCSNRLTNLRNYLHEKSICDFRYAVAIENGVCLDEPMDMPYDVGAIMIYDNISNTVQEILTERVYFDKPKYDKVISCDQKVTIGDIFAEMHGYNSKDWHAQVDPEHRSREKLLELAILNQFVNP